MFTSPVYLSRKPDNYSNNPQFEIKRNTYINMISIIINCGQKSFIEYYEVIKSNTQGLHDKSYHAGSYLIPYYSCIIYDMIIFSNSTSMIKYLKQSLIKCFVLSIFIKGNLFQRLCYMCQ